MKIFLRNIFLILNIISLEALNTPTWSSSKGELLWDSDPMLGDSITVENSFSVIIMYEQRANAFGLCWSDIDQPLKDISSKTDKVIQTFESKDQKALKIALADLIIAPLSLAAFCKIDPAGLIPKDIQKPNKIDHLFDIIKTKNEGIKKAYEGHDKKVLTEEIGVTMTTVFSLTAFFGFDPAQLILRNAMKFPRQFTILKQRAAAKGLATLTGQPLDVVLAYWKEAEELTVGGASQ